MDPGDESRWDKAVADAYDLDLRQGGDADEASAASTLCVQMTEVPKQLTLLKETTQLLPYQNTVPHRSGECPKIVRFSTRQYVRGDSDIVSSLESLGITVLHVGQKYYDSHDLVLVASPAFPYVTDQFVLEDVNPTQPTGHERHKLGNPVARVVAQRRFLRNALSAIFYTDVRGPASCYRDMARKNGLLARLEALTFHMDFEVRLSVSLRDVAR